MRFEWNLLPLQRKLDWELERAKGRLVLLLGESACAASALRELEQTRARQAGSASAVLQRRADPGLHVQALAYFAAMHARIAHAHAEQLRVQQELTAARAECLRCQQRLDTLEAVHDRALARHIEVAGRRAAKEADLDWLVRHGAAASIPIGGDVQ